MGLARLLVLFVCREPRAACPWVAGAGGAFLPEARGGEAEIARPNRCRPAEQLSIIGSAN